MKKLERIPEKGVMAGVIAGIAEYATVDVTVLRLVFLLFVLVTGIFPGVVFYILAIFIMPVKGAPVIHEHKDDTHANTQ